MLFDYVVYHKNCFDGFTGFYLFTKTKKLAKDIIVYPDVPSATNPPPDINGKNIIVIDVAYKPEIVKKIAERAKMLLFIDHHKTIAKEIKNLKLSKPHEIVYDVEESGASLVWKYFFKSKEPRFLRYIRDNDIGKWEIPETLDFMAYLEVHFETVPSMECLKHWDLLLDNKNLDKFIENGKNYNIYKNYLIKNSSRKITKRLFPSKKFTIKNSLLEKPGKFSVFAINSSCPSTSLLGRYIVENNDCDFCALYHYNMKDKKWIVSLRSNKADVGEIAKLLGGGGHKYAAAFSLNSNKNIEDLFV